MSLPAAPLPAPVAGPVDVLLIDNFDSFTWNLYQYLEQLGAKVTVVRNDALTPNQLPISASALFGISNDAIRYFAGKVPVLGVCMGLECIVHVFGGEIAYAGEIVHGKIAKVNHDARGCFKAITAATEESGVIMGVRHRTLCVEAVQYHPESILTTSGPSYLKNFLQLNAAGVLDAPSFTPVAAQGAAPGSKVPTILEKIHAQRLKDVFAAKATPGSTPADLESLLSAHLLPRLRQTPAGSVALMTEIKRASPSKGNINIDANVADQGMAYALAGSSVISVLTEPNWFKGSLQDMRNIRQIVDSLPNRPAILRKDFIIDEYQITEARLYGADTILLIVAILSQERLAELYNFAHDVHGMEPLVEVNNAAEMEIALNIGARVIGVNNRNLHDFQVDMGTTTRLVDMVNGRDDVILCALSGITGPEDVRAYIAQGVRAVLVGEALMRATDPGAFVRALIGREPASPAHGGTRPPLVKVCGVRTPRDAVAAAEAGADFIGVVLAPASKRRVSIAEAAAVSAALRAAYPARADPDFAADGTVEGEQKEWFEGQARTLEARLSIRAPLLVGVFQDQPLADVVHAVDAIGLDLVQLHGREPLHWSRFIPVPVIRAFHLPAMPLPAANANEQNGAAQEGGAPTEVSPVEQQPAAEPVPPIPKDLTRPGLHNFVLLDALRPGALVSGGSGRQLDARAASKAGVPFVLAGGLNVHNVRQAVRDSGAWAVDVSGGVEQPGLFGVKDLDAVRAFVRIAKEAWVEVPEVAE
ncbi:indole-3-glycerol phosphate synthase-domain-containing protein [Auriculariales sp. MPI-PUGE-AT-0066]|nr:indole-3-glycerol phosphate synthase-domain-containing protein [Auriculariales sp. MPI-PUGE-AT-0066]